MINGNGYHRAMTEVRPCQSTWCVLPEHDDSTPHMEVPRTPHAPADYGPKKRAASVKVDIPSVEAVVGRRYVDSTGRELHITTINAQDGSGRNVIGNIVAPGDGGVFTGAYACDAKTFDLIWRPKP
jgi:hypothetical protein